ncbi:MAG TPA: hypothetical protein DDZ89_07840 [Clostridiales bacterium]|nr:hypothetical protein [Clostridiales bacterium]
MQLNIAKKHKIGGIERGIYYFDPQNYPDLTALDIKNCIDFITYEKAHGRETDDGSDCLCTAIFTRSTYYMTVISKMIYSIGRPLLLPPG